MSEPTPEQTAAARQLQDVRLEVVRTGRAWSRALSDMGTAVNAAHEAGIPAADLYALATGRDVDPVDGTSAEKIRVMVRRATGKTRF